MTVRLNPSVTLLALGIIQPASPDQVRSFLSHSLMRGDANINVAELDTLFQRWELSGLVVLVHGKLELYSLTSKGNHSLTKEMRHLRDRTRLFLLKDMRNDKLNLLGDSNLELADASSASLHGLVSQEEQRPIIGPAPRRQAPRRGPDYWPLLGKQLLVGSFVEAPSPRFRFGSFPTIKFCQLSYGAEPRQNEDFTITDLALGIGISPRLISSLVFNSIDHYRVFSIPKKSGGDREISAPRTMLKTVQHWVLDHLLYKLVVHKSCTSYQKGLSIYDNAYIHTKMKFVANFDIENFFPSITTIALNEFFVASGFGVNASAILSKLLTLRGGLPQGAPTSPLISNAFLADFDAAMLEYCDGAKLNYSRYADDVTISGGDFLVIRRAIDFAEQKLLTKKLHLNKAKTRIASNTSRQVVTGLVVNCLAQPTREYRRKIRAMFNHAAQNPEQFVTRSKELGGHLSYLSSFNNIRTSSATAKYIAVLHQVTKAGIAQANTAAVASTDV